jgi:hypothetical protein
MGRSATGEKNIPHCVHIDFMFYEGRISEEIAIFLYAVLKIGFK